MIGVISQVMLVSLAGVPAPASRPGPESRPACENVARIWREESSGLTEMHRRLYERIVCAGLRQTGAELPEVNEEAFQASLRLFLSDPDNKWALDPGGPDYRPQRGEGTIGWLAWCTVEACRRTSLTSEERIALHAKYHALLVETLQPARSYLLDQAFPNLARDKRTAIEQALSACLKTFDQRVKTLQEDFLYPALKSDPTPKIRSNLLRCFGAQGGLFVATRPSEAVPLYVRPEEAFTRMAIDELGHVDDQALFWILAMTVEKSVLNPEWGEFEASCALGKNQHWSISYFLRPVVPFRLTDAPSTQETKP